MASQPFPLSGAGLADPSRPDSWVDISSQPSSSSLSSVAEETGPTPIPEQRYIAPKRRRTLRNDGRNTLSPSYRESARGRSSSTEEFEESESESDKLLASSGDDEVLLSGLDHQHNVGVERGPMMVDDDDRTAVAQAVRYDHGFTPRPNAFSYPPSGQLRTTSQPVPGSHFPEPMRLSRPAHRQSHSTQAPNRGNHMPQNILSPSYNAATRHDEALRSSLSTLLSCAAAARGLSKTDPKTHQQQQQQQHRNNRMEPTSFRLIPQSEMRNNPSTAHVEEPTFKPTLRRESLSTSTSSQHGRKENKRKDRTSSRERRALKKAKHSASTEELQMVSPTLFTWMLSAGVVLLFSAISFRVGYSMGQEAGRIEAGALASPEQARNCAREAGRTSLGLRRSLARTAY